ncbi:MAG: twin-arginine translocase TatA/TatE family subunit [Crocinitomicaceae bacterium]|jgi:TatA/E family protein of Tat protein translocase|nr:twin-arginine translocase TatA/TatE family subunit [Crocinitomicaceae bacterium]MBK9592175.1 twin-arginine translocase TatA/TatE family subunit [Crocinitomicaceae bacterium]
MNLLFLNSIGTGEFILIILVVLMLFGSKGLPDIVKNLGKGMREIKAASDEIKQDIQNSALEMRRDLNVPTIDELTKTSELKELQDLTKNSEIKELENLTKLDDENPAPINTVKSIEAKKDQSSELG